MGPPRGASPPMRMTASWSWSHRPPNTRLWRGMPLLTMASPLRSFRLRVSLSTGCRCLILGDRSAPACGQTQTVDPSKKGARHPTYPLTTKAPYKGTRAFRRSSTIADRPPSTRAGRERCARADDRRWSSARAYLEGRDDGLVGVAPLLDRCGGRFADLLDAPVPAEAISALRAAEAIGRPLGSPPSSIASPPRPAATRDRSGADRSRRARLGVK